MGCLGRRRKMAESPIVDKRAWFLGRLHAERINDNAIARLRSHVRINKGSATRLRIGANGLGAGDKGLSLLRNKNPHGFTPIDNITAIRIDQKYGQLLFVIVQLGESYFEIEAFRLPNAADAREISDTFERLKDARSRQTRTAPTAALNSRESPQPTPLQPKTSLHPSPFHQQETRYYTAARTNNPHKYSTQLRVDQNQNVHPKSEKLYRKKINSHNVSYSSDNPDGGIVASPVVHELRQLSSEVRQVRELLANKKPQTGASSTLQASTSSTKRPAVATVYASGGATAEDSDDSVQSILERIRRMDSIDEGRVITQVVSVDGSDTSNRGMGNWILGARPPGQKSVDIDFDQPSPSAVNDTGNNANNSRLKPQTSGYRSASPRNPTPQEPQPTHYLGRQKRSRSYDSQVRRSRTSRLTSTNKDTASVRSMDQHRQHPTYIIKPAEASHAAANRYVAQYKFVGYQPHNVVHRSSRTFLEPL